MIIAKTTFECNYCYDKILYINNKLYKFDIIRFDMYKRVLIKLSGEQLQGKYHSGFDFERASWISKEIKKIIDENIQVVVMVGGGNYVRGEQLSQKGIQRVNADNIGMLATMMNAIALVDAFNHCGLDSRALSNIKADQVLDQFTHRRAISHLEKNRVVVVAGGTARPYLTTDTAAVSLALELDCDLIIKATKVDGVYDKDPMKNEDAKKYEELTLQEAVENKQIRVMDKAAIALAADYKQNITVCSLLSEDNLLRVSKNEKVGTRIIN